MAFCSNSGFGRLVDTDVIYTGPSITCGGTTVNTGDTVREFISVVFLCANDIVVNVEGNSLPIPDGTGSKVAFVGSGTYTQSGGPDIVVPSGYMGVLSWDGSVWSLSQSVEFNFVADGMVVKGDSRAISGDIALRDLVNYPSIITSYSKNLFDKEKVIYSKWINRETGRIEDSIFSTRSVSHFIPLKKDITYTVSGVATPLASKRIVLLDIMDLDASSQEYFEGQETITPDRDCYLVFYIPETSDKENIQVEVGSSRTSYEPYKKAINEELIKEYIRADGEIKEGEERAVSGGTVYPLYKTVSENIVSKNILSPENLITNKQQSASSGTVEVVEQTGGVIAYVEIKRNTTYTLSGYPRGTFGRRVGLYKNIDEYDHDTGNEVTSDTFNSGDNNYLILGVSWQGDTPTDLKVAQLEEGDKSTGFQPYGESKVKGVVYSRLKTFVLTGASFAYPDNPWFAMSMDLVNGVGYNRAVSGENITHTAQKLYEGVLWDGLDFDEVDALIIMHTHNIDVANEDGLKEDYQDYEPVTANEIPRNEAWDYVLKKYRADCFNRKYDPTSKFYDNEFGKPCTIIVMTDWHDGRTLYNDSVRILRDKHGFILVEVDKNIGFSKNEVHPVTGQQVSIIYSVDTQNIGGVTYGWHPIRRVDNPAQKIIAQVLADKILGV